jgi:hypothetical protein
MVNIIYIMYIPREFHYHPRPSSGCTPLRNLHHFAFFSRICLEKKYIYIYIYVNFYFLRVMCDEIRVGCVLYIFVICDN